METSTYLDVLDFHDPPTAWARPSRRGPPPGNGSPAHRDEHTGPGTRRSWRCRQCRALLARHEDALSVDGRLEHERVNPAGVVCRFVTVSRCRNVRAISSPSEDFTWFEGRAWEAVACARCASHLGWRWSSPESSFYGLLLQSITG